MILPSIVLRQVILSFWLIYAGLTFTQAARGTTGVTRRRMQSVGAGSLCLGLAILCAGGAAAVPRALGLWTLLVDLTILGCGVLYYVGFAPPAWLRRTWQEPELRAFLGLSAGLAGMADTEMIVQELERGVRSSLGVTRASIGLWDGDDGVIRFPSIDVSSLPYIPVSPRRSMTSARSSWTISRRKTPCKAT